jgi:fluoride ion exporter CrcB/FEX
MGRRHWYWRDRGPARAGVRSRSREAIQRAEHAGETVVHGVEHAGESVVHGAERLERHIRNEEPFWPAQIAAAAALVLYLTLPNKVVIGPQWLIPTVEGILLLGLVVSTPTRHRDQSPARRAFVIGLLALVSLTTFVSLILLTHFLLQGGKAAGHPLVVAGIVLWATNVLVFSIWFWELDRGGPSMRCHHEDLPPPDFYFPQMAEPELAPGWKPGFMDYLYTSFTNSTAFSPTDTMPWTTMAKCLMALQSAIALTTLALVVSRAVNILA